MSTASNVYRGTAEMKLQRRQENYSQQFGYVTEFEWRGMSELRARTLANNYFRAGVDYSLSVSHGIWMLVATDSTGSFSIDVWEIGVNKLSLHISRHPIVLAILDNSGDRQAVARGIKQALESTDAYADIADLDPVDPADEATLFAFLDAARTGEDSFYQSSYVLRHTTNVSNRFDTNVSDLSVDTIYSIAGLLSETQNPGFWAYPMPSRLGYKLRNIVDSFQFRYPATLNHVWGFLKYGSAESTAANNRINIVTEYEFGLISTLFYAGIV